MTSREVERVPIRTDEDLSQVRGQVRQAAADAGFGLVLQTKLVTAASELARNTLIHGGGGELVICVVTAGNRNGVTLSFVDSGPGIPDVDLALRDGYSSANGLGMGLSGSRRLVHDFELQSSPGEGTTVTVTVWGQHVPAGSPR